MAFSPDGKQAVSGGQESVIKLWDLEAGKELRQLEAHAAGVHGLAFSRDGRRVASAAMVTRFRCGMLKRARSFIGSRDIRTRSTMWPFPPLDISSCQAGRTNRFECGVCPSNTSSFWWSQVGWILARDHDETNWQAVHDWSRYPELVWLNRHHWVPGFGSALVCLLVAGWPGLVWGFIVISMRTSISPYEASAMAFATTTTDFLEDGRKATPDLHRQRPICGNPYQPGEGVLALACLSIATNVAPTSPAADGCTSNSKIILGHCGCVLPRLLTLLASFQPELRFAKASTEFSVVESPYTERHYVDQ